MKKDRVINKDGEIFARVDGKLHGPFNDRGSAKAGLDTEKRRAAIHREFSRLREGKGYWEASGSYMTPGGKATWIFGAITREELQKEIDKESDQAFFKIEMGPIFHPPTV